MDENFELVPTFKKTLFENTNEILSEYVEIGVDSLMKDGVFKDIPIVGTILSLCKLGCNLHDRNLLKQTITFINEFNSGVINCEKLNEYKDDIEEDKKRCEDELGRVLIILNRTLDTKRTIILAKLFKAYIDKKLDWNLFIDMSETVDSIVLSDLNVLDTINSHKNLTARQINNIANLKRLSSLGLIFDFQNQEPWQITKEYLDRTEYSLTNYGLKFYSIGFSNK